MEHNFDRNNYTIDDAFPRTYFEADDFIAGSATLTIQDFAPAEFQGETEKKIALSFSEDQRKLVLNKTNAITIKNLYGKKMIDWVNNRITLSRGDVAFQGRIVGGILVSSVRPPPAQTQYAQPAQQQVQQRPQMGDTPDGRPAPPPAEPPTGEIIDDEVPF